MIAVMSDSNLSYPTNTAARSFRGLTRPIAIVAVAAAVSGCASGLGHRAPMQFDLRSPISPAAAGALGPGETTSNYASLDTISGPATADADHSLLALSKAPAAAADPSLQAGGF
jgi:hypothetical protein